MSDFKSMDTAPRDGAIVRLKTHSGHEFLASYQSGFVDEDENDCYCWVAEEEGYPNCWCDGVCWTSNSEGLTSSPPIGWQTANKRHPSKTGEE